MPRMTATAMVPPVGTSHRPFWTVPSKSMLPDESRLQDSISVGPVTSAMYAGRKKRPVTIPSMTNAANRVQNPAFAYRVVP